MSLVRASLIALDTGQHGSNIAAFIKWSELDSVARCNIDKRLPTSLPTIISDCLCQKQDQVYCIRQIDLSSCALELEYVWTAISSSRSTDTDEE